MPSRSTRIKIALIAIAVMVLLAPFLYPTCRIAKEQLHVGISSIKWIVGPEGGILTMKISIKNDATCDANVESLQFRMYKLFYPDNTTQDVNLLDAQAIHTTIPAGGNITTNYAFAQPFSEGPRAVLAKITIILGDGSSLEVFDGLVETVETPAPQQSP
jgi:hypothetical protein